MSRWLWVFRFPFAERGTYDWLACTAIHQIYPIIGGKVVGDITSADIKALLNHWMNEGYAYTTVKKVYNLLTDYFQQAAAYTLMLNTGLRTGEALGPLNSDIDLENQVIHLQRGVKEISRREGGESTSGREVKIGKLKSSSSKLDIPLDQAAVCHPGSESRMVLRSRQSAHL